VRPFRSGLPITAPLQTEFRPAFRSSKLGESKPVFLGRTVAHINLTEGLIEVSEHSDSANHKSEVLLATNFAAKILIKCIVAYATQKSLALNLRPNAP